MPPHQGLLDGDPDRAVWDDSLDEEEKPAHPPSPVQQGRKLIGRVGSMLLGGGGGGRRSASPMSPGRDLRRTAYLDGVRGFAAFLVYWHHHQLWAHDPHTQNPIFEHGFGYGNKHHLAAFPYIRLLFGGGHMAVATFFVISGYVLSAKPLALVHSGDAARLVDNLASALFRRWLRLYIPLIVTTFVFMVVWTATGSWVFGMEHEKTWAAEVWRWYSEGKNFTFVFNMGGEPWFRYNPHLWSIPVEFKGSIVIYTVLLALARCGRNARLCCYAVLIWYFMYVADGWYCALFIAGMAQCDLDLLAIRGELPSFFTRLEPVKRFVYAHFLAIGLYLGGVPAHDQSVATLRATRGWYYLSLLKPQAVFDYKWFYLFGAANLVVASVPRLGPIKRFFESRFCQHLGRISYGLYLCHGPVLWLFGDRVYTAVGFHTDEQLRNVGSWADRFPLPRRGPLGLELGFLLPHFILLPLTLWLAEVVTRFVDEPSVRFAQWLYSTTLPPKPLKVGGGP